MKINIYCLGEESYKNLEYKKTLDFLKKEIEDRKCIQVFGNGKEFYINSDFIFAFEGAD